MNVGLRDVQTSDLKVLLQLVHNEKLPCPFMKSTLMGMGLEHIAVGVDVLVGLDARAVRAVLVSVLAERL